MDEKPGKPTIEMVTLKQLCAELKVNPREARERLRLAVRASKKSPELAKSHKPGHTWEWPSNSVRTEGSSCRFEALPRPDRGSRPGHRSHSIHL